MKALKTLCYILVIVGGINWGLVGLLNFDLVAWIAKGNQTGLARTLYGAVGIATVIYAICNCRCCGSESCPPKN